MEESETPESPWEVVSWRKLTKISGQAFSEIGKRNFGRPTCIAIFTSIALGTSRGMVLIFDQRQALKTIIGQGTKGKPQISSSQGYDADIAVAIECGSVTSIAVSADQSTIASGHTSGHIFTWDLARHTKPSLHIPPTEISRLRGIESDGHVSGASILHVGFLGARHSALASADDRGMAFSHFSSRGLNIVARSIKTTRILGRYPETLKEPRPRKPSSVLAFSPLPLGSDEHSTDSLGLVAMLTPYLLIIVSTTPVAQTQFKASRPKELAAHGAMSAALAWYPSVSDKRNIPNSYPSKVKLVYSWSNVLTLLEVVESETEVEKDRPPDLQFKPRKRWKCDETIVGLQWLSASVLAVLTITQQLIILEDASLKITDSSDLIRKHVYHMDLFSQQLSKLIESTEEEDGSMHGVVADAFYMSFKAYKGRLFLLGFNDIAVGALSNWADRLLALMEQGNFIKAIELATTYYNGTTDKATVGLPEEDDSRHGLVRDKLTEMMSASLRYAFGKNREATPASLSESQLIELATACLNACFSLDDLDYLFEDVYAWYADAHYQHILLELFEPRIADATLTTLPPAALKDLVNHFVDQDWNMRLEDMLCRLNPMTMDIDQITTLCRRNLLYDALLYLWNQALGDYTTILDELIDLANRKKEGTDSTDSMLATFDATTRLFAYLSFVLTSRIYPTANPMPEATSLVAKADIYYFLFFGKSGTSQNGTATTQRSSSSYTALERILDIDAPGFLSMLNEAFEDGFLSESLEADSLGLPDISWTETRRFGLSLNHQLIVQSLWDIMITPRFKPEDIVYLDMFVARNLPKFPQSIRLPGNVLQRVLVDLCRYSREAIAEDCQLSVEYLLSTYQPPDLLSMIPLFTEAQFYRVIKSVYRAEKQYALLLEACFQDREDPQAVFTCIRDSLKSTSPLNDSQRDNVRNVIQEHAQDMAAFNLRSSAMTLQGCAPDLHEAILNVLAKDEHAQYQYLQALFDLNDEKDLSAREKIFPKQPKLVEQFVRLLCDYDPHHISGFVETLKVGDLRLEEVLPYLETSGVVDAAVVLLAREGKAQDANQRIIQYLKTLEAGLLGLVEGFASTPDVANTEESMKDLMESTDKYARIGIWLCQGQTKAAVGGKSRPSQLSRKQSMKEALTQDEILWLDLIDTIVQVTRNVTQGLESLTPMTNGRKEAAITESPSESPTPSDFLLILRTVVQDTFTALLNTTSVQTIDGAHSKDMSFLRILRAFLNRASASSPSLSNLRAVLGTIFSAYSYEESLLDLANRLLDRDLFVQVSEVAAMRQRGWRPLGQVCEGCGRKVWGPGAGRGIWDVWAKKQSAIAKEKQDDGEVSRPASAHGKGKGKARSQERHNDSAKTKPEEEDSQEELGTLVVFSCRHIFHQSCLEEMQSTREEGSGYACTLCI